MQIVGELRVTTQQKHCCKDRRPYLLCLSTVAPFSALLSGKYVQVNPFFFVCAKRFDFLSSCLSASKRITANELHWRKLPSNDHLWKVVLVNVQNAYKTAANQMRTDRFSLIFHDFFFCSFFFAMLIYLFVCCVYLSLLWLHFFSDLTISFFCHLNWAYVYICNISRLCSNVSCYFFFFIFLKFRITYLRLNHVIIQSLIQSIYPKSQIIWSQCVKWTGDEYKWILFNFFNYDLKCSKD